MFIFFSHFNLWLASLLNRLAMVGWLPITCSQLPSGGDFVTIKCQAKINKMRNLKQQITRVTATCGSCVLPPVLPCLSWFVCPVLLTLICLFVVRWGIFYNFFLSWVGFANSLTKHWYAGRLVQLWQCACK